MESNCKAFSCEHCGKKFASQQSIIDHSVAKHGMLRPLPKPKHLHGHVPGVTQMRKKDRVAIAMDTFGDLPDGAFFQACQDTFSLEPEDFI